MLILYVTNNCPKCPKVKTYLLGKNINFEIRYADRLPDECMYYNVQSIPSVRLGNDVLPIGNDMKKLSNWLKKRGLVK